MKYRSDWRYRSHQITPTAIALRRSNTVSRSRTRINVTGAVHPGTTANPLATEPGTWSGVRLVLKDARGNERQIDVTPADLRSAAAARDALVLLAPGASLDVDVKTKVDVPTGVHSLRVEVHSLIGSAPDPSFVGGTLWLEAGNVTIKRGAWWKPWQ